MKKKLPAYYRVAANQIQVLTPMQRGVVGAMNLNLALQEALNPEGDGLRRRGFLFQRNGKVMQIRNNYDKETKLFGYEITMRGGCTDGLPY